MSSYYEKILATGEVKCIDEEIPFEIPQGWEWCRLRGVIYPPKYGTSSKSLSNGDVPVLRMGNIQDGKVVYDKLVFSNNVEDNRKYLLQDGDLLFNRTNSAELVGKTAIFKGNKHVIYAGYLILLRPIKTNSEYLNYIFSSPYVRSYCKEVKTIGVQQCNINAEKVSQLLVPIAPFEEQMRIVDKIKEVLPSVDKYSISQYNLDLLNVSLSECLKKSVLQEAIQGKLVPQIASEGTAQELLEQIKTEKQKLVKEGKLKKSALKDSVIFKGDDNKYWEKSGDNIVCIDEDIPFGIPSSWSWCRLGNIASVKGGKRIPVGEKLTTGNTGHMYIRVADMKENTVKTDDIHYISESIYQKIKSYTISTEDLYITVAGTIGSVGEIPKVFDNANLTENADKIVFRGICRKFLMYCLLSNFVQSQIKKCTTKVGQPKLAIVRIEDLVIPLPPIKEQYRIAHKIEQTASIMSR